MKKFDKMVQNDAERWATAEMFYGEGAGTRRKLINAEILTKTQDPAYEIALHEACRKLDMNKFAERAIKERKSIDRAAGAAKNFRAIRSGNLHNLSNTVFVVGGLAYVAHMTGADKLALEEAKKVYAKGKRKYELYMRDKTVKAV